MMSLLSPLFVFQDEEGGATPPEEPPFDWKDPEAWKELGTEAVFEHGPNILAAIAIFIIGRWVVGMVVGLVKRLMNSRGVDPTLSGFVGNILQMAGVAMVVIAAIGELGVDTTSFAAVLGAAAFAIGFALQGSLANFAAGVMIIFFRPFKAGDFVEAGGVAGVIEEISVFSTIMKTGDNKRVIVPNGQITGGDITNYSANDTRRVDLVYGISYDDDMKLARKTMEETMAKDDRILKDPAPTIGLVELGDNSVNFVCRPWVKTADYWGVLFDLNEAMKEAFDAAGLNFPYPQRDVHMHQVK